MFNNVRTMVVDLDEVLVLIAPKWVSLLQNDPVFAKYFLNKQDLTKADVLKREDYGIDTFITDGEELAPRMKQLFYNHYINGDFYADLSPLNEVYTNIISFANSSACSKFILLTHTREGTEKSKSKWIKTWITQKIKNKSILDIQLIPSDCKKTDYLKTLNFMPDIYIDDSTWNIKDFITYSMGTKQYISPLYGYNKMLGSYVKRKELLGPYCLPETQFLFMDLGIPGLAPDFTFDDNILNNININRN